MSKGFYTDKQHQTMKVNPDKRTKPNVGNVNADFVTGASQGRGPGNKDCATVTVRQKPRS